MCMTPCLEQRLDAKGLELQCLTIKRKCRAQNFALDGEKIIGVLLVNYLRIRTLITTQ